MYKWPNVKLDQSNSDGTTLWSKTLQPESATNTK